MDFVDVLTLVVRMYDRLSTKVDSLRADIADLSRKVTQSMAVTQEVAAVVAQLDTATTAIATRIEALIAKIPLTAEDQAEFNRVIAALQALGQDPENPVPAPPA